MNIAELLLQEAERRQRWREAVLAEFEVTGDPRDRVKRMEVAGVVARALRVQVMDNFFLKHLIQVVVDLGGVPIKPRNKRYYRNVRRRPGATAAPG